MGVALDVCGSSARAVVTGTVGDRVRDAVWTLALGNAWVGVVRTNSETLKNRQGDYVLPNVPRGTLDPGASYKGIPNQPSNHC